jgi:FtsZ-binding cell division protein ZapB
MTSVNEEDEQPINPAQFGAMIDLMITCDNKLKVMKSEHTPQLQKLCYLLYGATGCGKSTLLARLRSNKSIEAFQATMSSADKEVLEECGVEMGGRLASTTTVPQLVFPEFGPEGETGGLFDMPGIKDTQTFRRTVISISQRCFYKQLGKAKFIIVMSAHVLNDKQLLTTTYLSELVELFGADHFAKYIESCYFVLTNGDVYPHLVKERNERMMTWFMETAAMKEEALGPFIHRFYKNHIIIDYSIDDKDTVYYKLTTLLQNKGEPFDPKELKTGRLAVRGNKLNLECIRELDSLRSKLNEKSDTSLSDLHSRYSSLVKDVEKLVALESENKCALTELHKCKAGIHQNEQAISLSKIRVEDFKKREIEAKMNVQQYSVQKDNFMRLAAQVKSPEMQAFVSTTITKSGFSQKQEELLSVTVARPIGLIGEPVFIAFEPEHFNSFREAFKRKSSFNDAIEVGGAPLFHSRTGARKPTLEMATPVPTPDGYTIYAKSKTKFIVVYLYETVLSESNKNGVVTSFYVGLIRESSDLLDDIQMSTRTLTNKIVDLEDESEQLTNRVSQLTIRIPQLTSEFEELQKKVTSDVGQMHYDINSLQSEIDRVYVNGDLVKSLKKIGEILSQNELGYDMKTRLDTNKELAMDFKTKLEGISNNILKEDKRAKNCKLVSGPGGM